MPFFSSGSALAQQFRLKPLNLGSKKYAKKILSGSYQPVIPLRFDLSNHRPKNNNLIEKIYSLGTNWPFSLFDNEDNATHRDGGKPRIPKITHKSEDSKISIKETIREEEKSKTVNLATTSVNSTNNKDQDKQFDHKVGTLKSNRVSRLDNNNNKEGDKRNQSRNSSSYDLTSANQRSITSVSKHRKTGSGILSHSASVIFEPSLESIAMRIVSAAASKTMGRSHHPAQASSSDSAISNYISSGNEPSFLSSLSSTIISTAISHIMNMTALNSTSAETQTTWPTKLGPVIQSLLSLPGFSSGDGTIMPTSSSSFLPTDLLTSSSSSIPGFVSSNGTRPHSAKQYSPTMTGLINLMRYVLCKFIDFL